MDQSQLRIEFLHVSVWHDAFSNFARLAPERAAYVESPGRMTAVRFGDIYFSARYGGPGTAELGSVFRAGPRGTVRGLLDAMRNRTVSAVRCTAFKAVADSVWIPLGFEVVSAARFDWAQAPLLWRSAYGTPDVLTLEMKL